MVANLVDQILGLDLLCADTVDGREQGEFVRRVAALQHAVDLLRCGRTLELLAVQHLVFQLFDRLRVKSQKLIYKFVYNYASIAGMRVIPCRS